jgi:uncharacterized protein DUF397
MTWRKSSFSGPETDCVELAWHKASFSASQTDCVEVAWPVTGVAVRDSKNPAGPILLLSERAHAALIATLTE